MKTEHFTVHHIQVIPHEDDHQAIAINYTGGFKIWQLDEDEWSYGPILHEGKPCIIGKFSFAEAKEAIEKMNLCPIGYEHHTSLDGSSMTVYMSVYPVSPKNPMPATDVWQTISGNIQGSAGTSGEILGKYAHYLTASLRSMDIAIAQISNHYHTQLIQSLRDGTEVGRRFSTLADLTFIANIHSFFLHFGSARDYLATLIARRCGLSRSIDSLASLVKKLDPSNLPNDPILKHMLNQNLIIPTSDRKAMEVGGWLKQATTIRNSVVHKHPYGSRKSERSGMIIANEAAPEMRIYWRPIIIDDNDGKDALDIAASVYHDTMRLLGCIAEISNYDANIPVFDEESILDLQIKTGKA